MGGVGKDGRAKPARLWCNLPNLTLDLDAGKELQADVALNDPPPSFRLGATVTAKLSSERSALHVPTSAVLTKDAESFLWVVDLPASTVSLRRVDLS